MATWLLMSAYSEEIDCGRPCWKFPRLDRDKRAGGPDVPAEPPGIELLPPVPPVEGLRVLPDEGPLPRPAPPDGVPLPPPVVPVLPVPVPPLPPDAPPCVPEPDGGVAGP